VSKAELTNLLDSRKRKFEAQLHEEISKRRKLEKKVQLTKERSDQKKLKDKIAVLKEANKNYK